MGVIWRYNKHTINYTYSSDFILYDIGIMIVLGL